MNDSVLKLKGVGPKTGHHLESMGIITYGDLILYTPVGYTIYENFHPSEVFENKTLCLTGFVSSLVYSRRFKNSVNSLIFTLSCEEINVKVLIFGQEFWRYRLKKHQKITVYGGYKYKTQEIIAKEILLDFYGTKVESIYDLNIPNKTVSKLISVIFEHNKVEFDDILPLYLVEKYRLLEYNEYIKKSHFPENNEDVRQITRRKKYQSYLELCLSFESLRYYFDITERNVKLYDVLLIDDFIKKLPYDLTLDQKKAIDIMLSELKGNKIMNRLLQGDVGSGKSIVALIIALANVSAGYQVVLMAPTEILALQHYNYFNNLLNDYKIHVKLLTGSTKISEKNDILERVITNRINILIGTHALIQDNVKFKKLGLVIVDEQHRFGVNERSKLINKDLKADSLFLTATPIPRTLGIARFGDLDISSLKTKPEGRKKVLTKVVDSNNIDYILNEIKKNVLLQHQAFVVVPLVNESEVINAMDLNTAYNKLKEALPDVNIGTIHGNMKSVEKESIMAMFKANKISVLVSTTVIEVGVDIKNATLMVVFNAERFGLSQLHQLRGRVGRNSLEGKCFLVTNDLESKRLSILESTDDCFILSDEDLKLRGPGDFLGERQSGFIDKDFESDINIYKCAHDDAKDLYINYINKNNNYKIVKKAIENIQHEKTKFN